MKLTNLEALRNHTPEDIFSLMEGCTYNPEFWLTEFRASGCADIIPDEIKVLGSSEKEMREAFEKGGVDPNLVSPAGALFTTLDNEPYLFINTDVLFNNIDMIKHELIHYQQWKRGDLIFDHEKGVIWKGQVWDKEIIQTSLQGDIALADQLLFPWEVEAYLLTIPLEPIIKVGPYIAYGLNDDDWEMAMESLGCSTIERLVEMQKEVTYV